jgi:hypothetical protein
VKVKINIGKSQLEIDEQNEMMAIHKAIILGNVPGYCQVCKNNQYFKMDSNKDREGNIYVNVICKCGAKAKLGQYKTGGYFWHKFEVYEPKKQQQGQPQPDPTDELDNFTPPVDDSVPFN